jgi:hypothetical protein
MRLDNIIVSINQCVFEYIDADFLFNLVISIALSCYAHIFFVKKNQIENEIKTK